MRYCLKCKKWSKPVETKEDRGNIVSTTIKCGNCGKVLFRYGKGKTK